MTVKTKETGTICPQCGKVAKADGTTEQAWGLSSYIRKGYTPQKCRACQIKARTEAN